MDPEQLKELLKQASAEQVSVFVKQTSPIIAEKIDLKNRRVTVQAMTVYEADLHGHRMWPETIKEALISYMAEWQVIGRMHKHRTNSYPVMAWQDDFGNGWLVIQVVDDEDWLKITSGEYEGTSWGGWAMAAELPDGTFVLSQVTMAEDSFVTKPAVPEATFKAEDGAADDETLLAQLASGKVKPRVNTGKKPGQMKAGSWGDRVLAGFLSLMHSNDPTDVGGESTTEDDDMKPEQEAKLDALIGKVDSLAAEVEGMKGQAAPAEQQDDKAKEADAETAAKGLTIEDVQKAVAEAIKPLQEKVEAQAAELAEIGKTAAPSRAQQGTGGDGEREQRKQARCAR